MKKRLLALLCALLLPLSACAKKAEEPPVGAYKVYFAVSGERAAAVSVDYEYRTLEPGTNRVLGLVDLLLAGPTKAGLATPLPASGVRLLSAVLEEEGRLHLDLSEQYDGLPGVYLTVANACFTLTLTQLSEVETVYITVEGEPLPYQAIQPLRESDLLISGAEEQTVSVSAQLYFAHKDGDKLGSEYRDVVKTEDDSLPAAVVSALLAGPKYENLVNLMPEGTELRSAKIENGVCRVDLSQEFITNTPQLAGEARLVLYSIVNTLCALGEVKVDAVQIFVEGKPVTLYGGVPTLMPLEPNFALLPRS